MNNIMYSLNSGLTWFPQNIPSQGEKTYSIVFNNTSTGYCCGVNGIIYKTTNGGVKVENISTEIPINYYLSQNYPNPFNPVTNIQFSIPQSTLVKLAIFDIIGREVEILVNEQLQTGVYKSIWNGERFSSGIYFYKLITSQATITKSMVLIK